MAKATRVSIQGDAFHLNGRPTYDGRTYQSKKIEGLLLNARMVQGIFDDRHPNDPNPSHHTGLSALRQRARAEADPALITLE
jgi:hypothetical protein